MTIILTNFRTNKFHLMGQDISIAGMAGLHNAQGISAGMNVLKEMNREVLINLHESENFSSKADTQGLTYYWERMDDFDKDPLYPGELDQIYKHVCKAITDKQGVTISCGSGNGRTGVALTSLKLRELIERQFKTNPSDAQLEAKPSERFTIIEGTKKGTVIPCTPLVREAIDLIRNECITPKDQPDNGKESVETGVDILSLMKYESHLRKQIALQIKKDSNYDPTFLPRPASAVSTDKEPTQDKLVKNNKSGP